MGPTTKNLALLAAGLALLAWCVRVVAGLLTGGLPALSGATIGAVLLLLAGLGACGAAGLRMGLVEVVEVEEAATVVGTARAGGAGDVIG